MANATILSAIITVIYITAVTVTADLYTPLKEALKNICSHHWIGKSITAILVFAIFWGLFLLIKPKTKPSLLLNLLTVVSILAAFVIFIFFTWETLR